MSVVCEMAAPFVASSAVDRTDITRMFRSHTETCLKCQARHAAMSRTARELASMHAERFAAPADLEWRVMTSLEGELAVARTWAKPVAWCAAALSMAAAILIWRLKPKIS
jgi:anti-sigma factor RsiW